jgi:mono/diheme cytochrome c family protein
VRKRIRICASLLVIVLTACSPSPVSIDIEEQDPQLVEQGAPLYQQFCAQCHGTDLRGTDLGPSHLSIVYEPNHHGDAAFLAAVGRGSPAHHWNFGPMPPIPGLSEDDIAAITAFVRDQQRIHGFESYSP